MRIADTIRQQKPNGLDYLRCLQICTSGQLKFNYFETNISGFYSFRRMVKVGQPKPESGY